MTRSLIAKMGLAALFFTNAMHSYAAPERVFVSPNNNAIMSVDRSDPKWRLLAGDQILGAWFYARTQSILVRRGNGVWNLKKTDSMQLWNGDLQVDLLDRAIAASSDDMKRVFILDQAGNVYWVHMTGTVLVGKLPLVDQLGDSLEEKSKRIILFQVVIDDNPVYRADGPNKLVRVTLKYLIGDENHAEVETQELSTLVKNGRRAPRAEIVSDDFVASLGLGLKSTRTGLNQPDSVDFGGLLKGCTGAFSQ